MDVLQGAKNFVLRELENPTTSMAVDNAIRLLVKQAELSSKSIFVDIYQHIDKANIASERKQTRRCWRLFCQTRS